MNCDICGAPNVRFTEPWSFFGTGQSGKEEDHRAYECRNCGMSGIKKRPHSHSYVRGTCMGCGRGK